MHKAVLAEPEQTQTVSFKVSVALAVKVRTVAASQNKSRSEAIREALTLWLDSQDNGYPIRDKQPAAEGKC